MGIKNQFSFGESQDHYTPRTHVCQPLKRKKLSLKGNFFLKPIYFLGNWVYNTITYKEGSVKMSNIGNKETFARNLLYYIEKHGKEQKELAEIVGVAPSTFNAWVKAKKYPRIDKIELLANYFGILKSDLIEEHNSRTSLRTVSITEDEQKLLDLFRLVPENQQQMVLQMIEIALNTNK